MGRTEQAEDVLETIDAIEHPISKTLKVLVNICAFAGTGNVLQIQALLQMCTAKPKDQLEEEKLEQSEEEQQQQNKDTKSNGRRREEDVEMEDAESKNETSENTTAKCYFNYFLLERKGG